jgi:hypothetical protein
MPSNQHDRVQQASHNVLASTLLPRREFMEASFKIKARQHLLV